VVGTSANNFAIVRYTSTGALDTTFGGTGKVTTNVGSSAIAYDVVIQSNGKIVAAGKTGSNIAVACYLTNGSLDTIANGGSGFGEGSPQHGYVTTDIAGTGTDIAYGVALTSSGKIVVTGSHSSGIVTVQYTSAGVLDTGAFGAGLGYVVTTIGTTSIGYSVAINSSGKIIVAGVSDDNFMVAQYTSAGVLDTGSFGSGVGYVLTDFGGVDIGSHVVIQSNGYIVVVGKTDGNIALGRYTTTGALDSTFGSGGKVITVLSDGIEARGMGLFIQPNNKIVTCASVSSLDGDFITARYLGDSAPQGCVDVTYQSNGYLTYPTGSSAGYNPRVTSLQIQSDNSVYVVSQDLLTTAESRLVKLNADGSTAFNPVIISQTGAVDVIENSQGAVLVVGTNGTPRGWMMRYTTVGSLIADATFGSSGLVVETTNSSSFKRIGQQSNGRYIVMGQGATATTGVLIAYNQYGAIDTTFGTSGIYSVASRTFSDMVIGSDDVIYIAYQGATDIEIRAVKSDGSGLVAAYNSGAAVDTSLISASYGSPSIAFDNNGKLLLTAVATATYNMAFKRYTTTGTLDVSTTITNATTLLTTPVVIKQLQCDTNNRPIFVGYSYNSFLVGRLNSSVTALDTTFAPNSSIKGILKTAYNSSVPTDATTPKRVASTVGIAPSGTILFGGYEAITSTTSTSLLANVVGDTTPYEQVNRYPRKTVGGIDQSFGVNGNLSLASIVAMGVAKKTTVLDSGKILIAIDNYTDTILIQLNSDYSLDTTSFGSGTGLITLPGLVNPDNIFVDPSGNIYVSGQNDNTSIYLLFKIISDGSAIIWTTSTSFVLGNNIRMQVSGRILCIGNNETSGIVVGFNPNNGNRDSFFGNNTGFNAGYYETPATSQIADLVVVNDYEDEFILVYRDISGNAIVESVEQNGSALNPNFTFGTPIANVSADNQVHMTLSTSGKIVVVARNVSGDFIAQRYNANGTDDVGPVTITLINPSTTVLQETLSLDDGSTLILGSNSNGNTLITARLNSSFALDTTFNTTGLLEEPNLPMSQFYDFDVTSTINNNMIVVGSSSTSIPYVTNLYNNIVSTQAPQSALAIADAGTLDQSLNADGLTPGYFDLHTDLGTTQLVYSKALKLELNIVNGTYYIAADNGFDTQITSIDGYSDLQISTFGTSGIITLTGKTDVGYLYLNTQNYLNVVGGVGASGSNAGWVERYDGITGIAVVGFSVTDVLDINYACGEQSSGRILVAGQEDGVGKIIAYNSETGTLDTGFASSGRYTTGYNSPITSMLVGADNSIYFVSNNGSGEATVQKISEDGTSLLWTGDSIVANSSIPLNSHIALNTNEDFILATVDISTPQIVIKKYNTSSGVTSETLNLTNVITGFTDPYIYSVVVDINNKMVINGYDNIANDTAFVTRVLANFTGLDSSFNPDGPVPGIQPYAISPSSTDRAWNDVHINGQGRLLTIGFVTESGNDTPYLIRFYGDPYARQTEVILTTGGQGTLDLTFNTTGTFNLNSLNVVLNDTAAHAIVTLPTDFSYIGFDNGISASYITRLDNSGDTLDINYNSGAAFSMPIGFGQSAPQGVTSIMIDGADRVLLTGTDGSGGWVQRYVVGDSGAKDTTFGSSGVIAGQMSNCSMVAQQTLGRYIVAGTSLTGGYGVLRAYTLDGLLDATFHSTGSTPGEYNTGIVSGLYSLLVDECDRIYIAYKNGTSIDVVRLAANGYLDASFNSTGVISSVISNADDASQVRIVVDSFGNIVIATHINDGSNKIALVAYDTTGTALVYSQVNLTNLIDPVLTCLYAKTGGKIELSGYQSGDNSMWVARISSIGTLDESFGVNLDGLMQFSIAGTAQTSRVLQSFSVRSDGNLSEIGYELVGGVKTPYIARSYDSTYQKFVPISSNQRAVGTIDNTLGRAGDSIIMMFNSFKKYKQEVMDARRVGLRSTTINGIEFYASFGADATYNQVAQTIAMQDVNTFVVALDGGATAAGDSQIFINEFDVNGVVDTSFNGTGQASITHYYENEYVRDMVTFSTIAGVNKAILVGYATNTALASSNSLIWQYDLTNVTLDTSFGGFNGSPLGIAFSSGKEAHVVGMQSNNRIIVSGLDQSGNGLVLGYTSLGKIDKSFGVNGSGSTTQGTTGIYTHAIDTENRIVIAYNDGSDNVAISRILADGSALDSSFGAGGSVTDQMSGISGNTNIQVAIDANNQVVAAAVVGTTFVIYRYSADGTTAPEKLTIAASDIGGIDISSIYTISKLIIDTSGQAIVTGYDAYPTPNNTVVMRATPTLSGLDTTDFNAPDGYIAYQVAIGNSQVVTDSLIHPDGRIVLTGWEY